MPILKYHLNKKRILVVSAMVSYYSFLEIAYWMHCIKKAVLFEYNVQHDCHQAGCIASGTWAVVQEWVESQVMETFIEHKPLDSFVINMHAFHNMHLIQSILPKDLTVPMIGMKIDIPWIINFSFTTFQIKSSILLKAGAVRVKSADYTCLIKLGIQDKHREAAV